MGRIFASEIWGGGEGLIFLEGLIFGAAYYWRKLCVSKWFG